MNAFQTVDKSLDTANNTLGTSAHTLYSEINLNRNKNQELALKADTLYLLINTAISEIDNLRQQLLLNDTVGDKIDIAMKLIERDSSAINLGPALINIYNYSNKYPIDSLKRQELYYSLKDLKKIKDSRQWAKEYFEHVPSIAAVTILSKFKNDCINTEVMILDDVSNQLKK